MILDDKELVDKIKELEKELDDISDELYEKYTELYKKYNDERVIFRKTGIPVAKIRKYIKFARLPPLKDEVGVVKIPLDEIDEDCNSTRTSPPDTLKGLIEHIAKHGLVEPIVVCKGDDEKYEIVAGQRRYCAYVVLNKNHPGEGWDKIPARSRGDCGGIEEAPNPSDSSDSPTIDAK